MELSEKYIDKKEELEQLEQLEQEEQDEDEDQSQDDEDLMGNKNKKNEPPMKYKFLIYSIPLVVLILVIIGLIIVFSLPKASGDEEPKDYPKKGKIKCFYFVRKNDLSTKPISEKYLKENEFEFYVEGLKIKNYQNFKFEKIRR